MRLKYYIRGLGAGILLATILLSVSFFFGGGYKNKELSDEEIIARAEKLGMVMEEKDSKEDTEKTDSETSEEDADTVDESSATEEKPEEEMTIDEFVEEAEETNAAEQNEDDTVSYQAFTVKSGESSETIANLYKQGLVDSSASFNKYLGELGVDNRIQSGTFYVQVGSSYDDIVALLVNKEARTTTPPEN